MNELDKLFIDNKGKDIKFFLNEIRKIKDKHRHERELGISKVSKKDMYREFLNSKEYNKWCADNQTELIRMLIEGEI